MLFNVSRLRDGEDLEWIVWREKTNQNIQDRWDKSELMIIKLSRRLGGGRPYYNFLRNFTRPEPNVTRW